jgi:hypothetical protein
MEEIQRGVIQNIFKAIRGGVFYFMFDTWLTAILSRTKV